MKVKETKEVSSYSKLMPCRDCGLKKDSKECKECNGHGVVRIIYKEIKEVFE